MLSSELENLDTQKSWDLEQSMHEATLNSDNVLIDVPVIITPVQINRLL